MQRSVFSLLEWLSGVSLLLPRLWNFLPVSTLYAWSSGQEKMNQFSSIFVQVIILFHLRGTPFICPIYVYMVFYLSSLVSDISGRAF
ncbi:hypothetical protein OESDEN_19627 [Oesophagostomum dentatum]|uniref:Uncharacterized protein n=1 Tax=Oesophagostomum dentatum TaxID=61180 RepID=A0A0B1S6Z7_OESDE|nr:hypothetical protein OESDEN_19627 [Oesophagostomum dentatum]